MTTERISTEKTTNTGLPAPGKYAVRGNVPFWVLVTCLSTRPVAMHRNMLNALANDMLEMIIAYDKLVLASIAKENGVHYKKSGNR